jgi:hypothetical protein
MGRSLDGQTSATHILKGMSVNGASPPASLGLASHAILSDSATPMYQIFLYDDSTLEVEGLTFNANLLDRMNDNGIFSEYQLSGTFGDGPSIPDGLLHWRQFPIRDRSGTGQRRFGHRCAEHGATESQTAREKSATSGITLPPQTRNMTGGRSARVVPV